MTTLESALLWVIAYLVGVIVSLCYEYRVLRSGVYCPKKIPVWMELSLHFLWPGFAAVLVILGVYNLVWGNRRCTALMPGTLETWSMFKTRRGIRNGLMKVALNRKEKVLFLKGTHHHWVTEVYCHRNGQLEHVASLNVWYDWMQAPGEHKWTG